MKKNYVIEFQVQATGNLILYMLLLVFGQKIFGN